RGGDHQAFEALFKKYCLPLTRFAWRFVSSHAVSQELVQEVFADIWEKRETLVIHGSIRPYLYKATKNCALNFLKRNEIKKECDTLWVEKMETTSMFEFEGQEETEQLRKMIGRAVEELPPRSRMTYKLHRHDGLTYEEIAEVMNISVKTVESQMTRTLKILRERLAIMLPCLLMALLGV
ncbi:MAG: RNA polymerase sigma-70 factor, partial [Balneolaceae bacterium]